MFCDEGGLIVDAPESAVADLVEATTPVTEALREDPMTASIIDEIERLRSSVGEAEPVEPCDRETDAAVSALDGTYRTTVTVKAMSKIGVTDEFILNDSNGRFTLTLRDGTWSAKQIRLTGPEAGETWYGTGELHRRGRPVQLLLGPRAGRLVLRHGAGTG